MKTHTYKVRAESTGAFIVTAASPEQAEEIVLDHMERAGTPYSSAPHNVVQVCHEGADRVLSITSCEPRVCCPECDRPLPEESVQVGKCPDCTASDHRD